eukprot:6296881-Ditylum_brightwellii.AAC.1
MLKYILSSKSTAVLNGTQKSKESGDRNKHSCMFCPSSATQEVEARGNHSMQQPTATIAMT